MEVKWKWENIGGILSLILMIGTSVYILQDLQSYDVCTLNKQYANWVANFTPIYIDSSHPALAKYTCSLENITKWCSRVSGSRCYEMKEISYIEDIDYFIKTPSSDTVCFKPTKDYPKGYCNAALYGRIINVLEDMVWKDIERANNKTSFYKYEISLDKRFPLEIINADNESVIFKFKITSGNARKNIPIIVFRNGKIVYNDSVKFWLLKDEIIKTIPMKIGDTLKYGFDSTFVSLKLPDTENIDDTYVTIRYPDSDLGIQLLYLGDKSGPYTNRNASSLIKWNISSFTGGSIISANMSLWQSAPYAETYSINVTSYRIKDRSGYNITNDTCTECEWNEHSVHFDNGPNATNNGIDATPSDTVHIKNPTGSTRYQWKVATLIDIDSGAERLNSSIYLNFTNTTDGLFSAHNKEEYDDYPNMVPELNLTYTPPDRPPKFYNNATNETLFSRPCNFSINVTDENLLTTATGYIFSTNNSGEWVNSSFIPHSSSDYSHIIWNVTILNETIGTLVQWKFYANDTKTPTQWNSSSVYNLTISGFPQSFLNSTNSTGLAGVSVIHSLNWTYYNGMSGFIFSFRNGTATFINDSWVSFNGGTWSNVTKSINFSTTEIYWKIFANNTHGNWNVSEIFQYNINDSIAPTSSSNITNSTYFGTACHFNISITDFGGLKPLGQYVFSTNNTGTWINESAVNFTSFESQTLSITKTLNNTVNLTVGWKYFFKDNAENWNSSELFTFRLKVPPQSVDNLRSDIIGESYISWNWTAPNYTALGSSYTSCSYWLFLESAPLTSIANGYISFGILSYTYPLAEYDTAYRFIIRCLDSEGTYGPFMNFTQKTAGWHENFTEFSYKRLITVNKTLYNQSYPDKDNFIINVTLNSTNFNFARTLIDGSDIRFIGFTEFHNFSYDIISWDNATQKATIKVRVSHVDADYDTKFYIYYGNSTSVSDDQTDGSSWDGMFNITTIGPEQEFTLSSLVIYKISETNKTSSSINISWSINAVSNHRIRISENKYFIGENWTYWNNGTKTPIILVGNLTDNKTYHYQVWSYWNNPSLTQFLNKSSATRNFTIGTIPSTVTCKMTDIVEDRLNNISTFVGELTDTHDESNIQLYFQYVLHNTQNEFFNETTNITTNDTGTFSREILDTYRGNVYYARMVCQGNETTGYSEWMTHDFRNSYYFFAGNPSDNDENLNIREWEGYWEGSLQQEDWIWVETNITGNGSLRVKWYNGTWNYEDMVYFPDSQFYYKNMTNLKNDTWYTFEIWNSSDMILNFTKASAIHLANLPRENEYVYLSFNGTPTKIDYTLLYMNSFYYNTTVYFHCRAVKPMMWCLGGASGFWDSVSAYGANAWGNDTDRGQTFRGGVVDGSLTDTGTLDEKEPNLLSPLDKRYCHGFTIYYFNATGIWDGNNISNYYFHYWNNATFVGDYGLTVSNNSASGLFIFRGDDPSLSSQTENFYYLNDTQVGAPSITTPPSTETYLSGWVDQYNMTYLYNRSGDGKGGNLLAGYRKLGTVYNFSGDSIYWFGFKTSGVWVYQMLDRAHLGFVIFNLPSNATLQSMDSDNDGINDYEELYIYWTNPKKGDSDNGGESDLHEIQIGRNPNMASDDEYPKLNMTINPTGTTKIRFDNPDICEEDITRIDVQPANQTLNTGILKFCNFGLAPANNLTARLTVAPLTGYAMKIGNGTHNMSISTTWINWVFNLTEGNCQQMWMYLNCSNPTDVWVPKLQYSFEPIYPG